MPRPPSANSLLKNFKKQARNTAPITQDIAGNLILPNHSGDHSKGLVRSTPSKDLDIVNKKYVDDAIAGLTPVSFGTDNQVPYTNATTDDFDYSSNLTFDGTTLTSNIASFSSLLLPSYIDTGVLYLNGNYAQTSNLFTYNATTKVLDVNTITPSTLTMTTSVTSIKDEDDMASDSATALATQQSIKAYVDDNGGCSYGTDNQIPYTNSGTNDFDYGDLTYDGTKLDLSKVDPEIRITDTGNNEYSRIVKSDTLNKAIRYNRVSVPANEITGGTITYTDSDGENPSGTPYSDGYVVHTFTSDGTLAIATGSIDVEVLVVAGGGGGGFRAGGGGGGGGVIYDAEYSASGNVTITIGAGGASTTNPATAGEDSVFGTLTADGGGRGGYDNQTGGDGGSGGGGGANNKAGGSGTVDQGYDGGQGNVGQYPGGGGGGAGEVGGNATSTNGGDGGDGYQSSLSGNATYYAGGGGGGNYGGTAYGDGGAGGGGHGAGTTTNAVAGTANTGGGGGGGQWARTGKGGGSGIVIVRYPYSEVVGSVNEINVWSSENGVNVGEKGIQKFGDADGKTILQGSGIHIDADDRYLYFGTADDAGIWYDGTNLYIDAQLVGSGNLILENIPSSDPSVEGAVYSDSGTLKISAG